MINNFKKNEFNIYFIKFKWKNYFFLLNEIYNTFDPECSNSFPKRCPNFAELDIPICAKNYSECEPFEGCTDGHKRFLCSNGECAENFLQCTEKYTTCSSSEFVRCILNNLIIPMIRI